MYLDVEINPKMPRTKSKAVPEGSDPFSHDDYGPGGLTMEEIYRTFAEELDRCFDRNTSHSDLRFEDMEEGNKNTQHLAGLKHQTQQPHLNAEADVKPDKNTCKRTEGVAADGGKYEDTSFAQVEDNRTSFTSFGNIAEPLASQQ